jgi:hypothetical protein
LRSLWKSRESWRKNIPWLVLLSPTSNALFVPCSFANASTRQAKVTSRKSQATQSFSILGFLRVEQKQKQGAKNLWGEGSVSRRMSSNCGLQIPINNPPRYMAIFCSKCLPTYVSRTRTSDRWFLGRATSNPGLALTASAGPPKSSRQSSDHSHQRLSRIFKAVCLCPDLLPSQPKKIMEVDSNLFVLGVD